MSGQKRLGVSELSVGPRAKSRGEKYLNEVEEELTGDHAANEGSEEDDEKTSDKFE